MRVSHVRRFLYRWILSSGNFIKLVDGGLVFNTDGTYSIAALIGSDPGPYACKGRYYSILAR